MTKQMAMEIVSRCAKRQCENCYLKKLKQDAKIGKISLEEYLEESILYQNYIIELNNEFNRGELDIDTSGWQEMDFACCLEE